MRACWRALHESLARSVRTLEAGRQFEEAKKRRSVLARFEDPISLLVHLTRRDGNLDEKDAIYAALVEAVQARGDDAALAMSLLWLGLWPALDAIFRRRQRHFSGPGENVVSEIADCFTSLVRRLDLSRVTRVAATLARGTDRDIGQARRRAWAEAARRVDLTEDDIAADDEEAGCGRSSELGLPPGLSGEQQVEAIRAWLVKIIPGDAEFVIAAVIHGENQRQLADRLGITHEAARKRFQRALDRLRDRLRAREACPTSPSRIAFSGYGGPHGGATEDSSDADDECTP